MSILRVCAVKNLIHIVYDLMVFRVANNLHDPRVFAIGIEWKRHNTFLPHAFENGV